MLTVRFHFNPLGKFTEIKPPVHYIEQDDIIFCKRDDGQGYEYASWLYKSDANLSVEEPGKLKLHPWPGKPGARIQMLRKPR